MSDRADGTEIRVLKEQLRGFAASTAILNEAAKSERRRALDTTEQLRVELRDVDRTLIELRGRMANLPTKEELEELRARLDKLELLTASATQVKVAVIGAAGGVIVGLVALLRTVFGG